MPEMKEKKDLLSHRRFPTERRGRGWQGLHLKGDAQSVVDHEGPAKGGGDGVLLQGVQHPDELPRADPRSGAVEDLRLSHHDHGREILPHGCGEVGPQLDGVWVLLEVDHPALEEGERDELVQLYLHVEDVATDAELEGVQRPAILPNRSV